MATRREHEDDIDLDDTVRNMRALTDSPGESAWRKEVANGFGGLDHRLRKIDERLIRIEERQLSRINVADMIKTELQVYKERLDTISRVMWGTLGTLGAALALLAINKIFAK